MSISANAVLTQALRQMQSRMAARSQATREAITQRASRPLTETSLPTEGMGCPACREVFPFGDVCPACDVLLVGESSMNELAAVPSGPNAWQRFGETARWVVCVGLGAAGVVLWPAVVGWFFAL